VGFSSINSVEKNKISKITKVGKTIEASII
jgi:hypothetical protein